MDGIAARGRSGAWHAICKCICFLCLMLVSLPACTAQVRGEDQPQLHRRSNQGTVIVAKRSASSSSLPEDASGEYMLGDSGSVIEISLQAGELDGYIAKLGDLESDRGTPLTYFFAHTELVRARLSFATRRVHGVWYSFAGSIVRGPAKTRRDAGFYLLEGELIEHNAATQSEQGRTISLKSSRRDGEY